MSNARLEAAEAYARSIRTGEHHAALALAKLLAADVELSTNGAMANSPVETVRGYDAVLQRASGNWQITASLRRARWTEPREEDGAVRLDATFENVGGFTPGALSLSFSFDAAGKITRIEQRMTPRTPAAPSATIPPAVKALINTALANDTPMTVAYTDESGQPVQTMRGSIQVYSDHQLCAWIRHADGGLVKSVAANSSMSFAYRDGTRAMFFVQGRARVDSSEEVRNRVYNLSPEVEQNHDPARRGAALIVDVQRIQGFATGGEPVRMARED